MIKICCMHIWNSQIIDILYYTKRKTAECKAKPSLSDRQSFPHKLNENVKAAFENESWD